MKSVKSHLYVVVCFSDAWTNFWWNRCSAADPAPSSSEYQPGPTVAVRPPLSYQSRRWCGPDVSAHRRCPWPLGVNTGGTWKYLAMFLHGDYIYIYGDCMENTWLKMVEYGLYMAPDGCCCSSHLTIDDSMTCWISSASWCPLQPLVQWWALLLIQWVPWKTQSYLSKFQV